MLGFTKFLVILGTSLTILRSGLAAPAETTQAGSVAVPVTEDLPKADSNAPQIPLPRVDSEAGNRVLGLGSLGGLGNIFSGFGLPLLGGGGKPKKPQKGNNGNGRPPKKYIQKETIYENVPSSRVSSSKNSKTKYRLVTTRTDPDGSEVTILRKKVQVIPGKGEVEVDYDDTNPSSITKTVKKKILPDGTETVHVFTSTNTREKIVSTIPASDGSDVTIIKKKVRTAPNGVDYEVDYDEEGPEVNVKTVQRVLKADGTVTFTENFRPSQTSTQTILTTVRKVVKTLPDGRVVEVEDTEQPHTTTTVVKYENNPFYKVDKTAKGKDGSQITIYTVKVKRREDGSEVEVDPKDDSPNTFTKIIRKVVNKDGTISVTQGYEEPQKSILIARVIRLIKRREDGSVVVVDEDDDTEPEAETIGKKIVTRRRQTDGTEIDTEDDENTNTRKVYTTYKTGVTTVTVYINGEVTERYNGSPKQRPKFSSKDIITEIKSDSTDEETGMSSLGSGVRDGLKGVLGVGDLASDAVSGLLGAGPVSDKKNIADQLLDSAVEGVGSIADVPGGIIDGLGKATGTSFLLSPLAYTGGFVGGGIAGGEVMKGKIIYDAAKTGAHLTGADALIGYDVKKSPGKKKGTSWFL